VRAEASLPDCPRIRVTPVLAHRFWFPRALGTVSTSRPETRELPAVGVPGRTHPRTPTRGPRHRPHARHRPPRGRIDVAGIPNALTRSYPEPIVCDEPLTNLDGLWIYPGDCCRGVSVSVSLAAPEIRAALVAPAGADRRTCGGQRAASRPPGTAPRGVPANERNGRRWRAANNGNTWQRFKRLRRGQRAETEDRRTLRMTSYNVPP